jgi:cell division septal protein FtsQ
MARRKAADADLETSAGEREAPRARPPWRMMGKAAGWTFASAFVLVGLAWLFWQMENFLVHDPRFRVPTRAADEENEAVKVSGVKRASKYVVEAIFDHDRGRSLFECDPEKRRLQLRGVEWVKDAVVRRVWPNHIGVQVFERTPVAFVRMAGGVTNDPANPVVYRPLLIDEEGVLLSPQGTLPKTLPLLTGVTEESDIEVRRRQVATMQRVLRTLRQYRQQIGEIDVTHPDEIRITCQIDQQAYALILGREQFRERLELFLKEYESMRGQLDARKEYDLTNENRIIAIDPEPTPEKALN